MNRKFSDELISAYLDGELTAEEKALVEEQLMDNVEHRKMFEELRALRASLQSLPLHKLDEKFHERVLRRAERTMLSPDSGDSKQDASGGAAAPQDADADTAAPHGQPVTGEASSGDTLVEPVRRTDSRRPSRGLLWTSLAVIACLLLIGVMIVLPRAGEQIADSPIADSPIADSRLDRQQPNAQNGGPAKARKAPQATADNPSATDAVAAGKPRESGADKRLPLAERRQAEDLRPSTAAGDAFEDGKRLSSRSRGGAGAGSDSDLANNPSAEGEQQSLRQAASRRAADGRAEDATAAPRDRYELGDRDRTLRPQPALSAVEQQAAGAPLQTRIVKVVMSQDAYQRGLFDEELARNQITVDRSAGLALHSSAGDGSAPAEEAKVKSLSKYDDAEEQKRESPHGEAGAFEVVMVDADPVQIESVVTALKSLPSEQVATIDYRQPSGYYYGNGQQLGGVAGPSGPSQGSDGESNGAVDGFSFARPGGNRAASDRPQVNRGNGGFGGGGLVTGASKDADRAARGASAPLADDAAPNAKAAPIGSAETKQDSASAGAPVRPRSPQPARKPSGSMGRANKGDAESVQDALPKVPADFKTRRDARPESAEAAEKKDDSGKEEAAGAPAPGSAPPAPSATEPPPPRPGETAAPQTELSAASALPASRARTTSEPMPANPGPLTLGPQDRLRVGTVRRLNEKEVKELTDALGRLEQVDQARDAAMQSVMEKAASVVADLEPAAEENAPPGDGKVPQRDEKALQEGGKDDSEMLKRKEAESLSRKAVKGEQRTNSSATPRPTADPRGLESPTEEPPALRGSVRKEPQPAAPGRDTHRLEDRKGVEPAHREELAAVAEGDDADGDKAESDEAVTGAALRDKMAERAEAANYRQYAASGGAGQGRMRVLFVIEVVPNRLPLQDQRGVQQQPAAETRASEAPAK
jgi:hypothetical protein